MVRNRITILSFIFCISVFSNIFAQNIGINRTGITADAAAILDLNTGNNFASPKGRGILIPEVVLTGLTDIATIHLNTQDTSLLVYDKKGGILTTGLYYWSGMNWILLDYNVWCIGGNAGTNPGFGVGQDYMGTSDTNRLLFGVNQNMSGGASENGPSYLGFGADSVSTVKDNTSIGYYALRVATNSSINNTGVGYFALDSVTTGSNNTAISSSNTLSHLTTGSNNTAVGNQTFEFAVSQNNNTAIGNHIQQYNPMTSNRATNFGRLSFQNSLSGDGSTAIGFQAGVHYTSSSCIVLIGCNTGNLAATGVTIIGQAAGNAGNNNTIIGLSANQGTGISNTEIGYKTNQSTKSTDTSSFNAIIGDSAGFGLRGGQYATLIGCQAAPSDTTGTSNTAIGYQALYGTVSGSDNTAIGYQPANSDKLGSGNSIIGWSALFKNTKGGSNTAMGYRALYTSTTGSNNTAIGDSSLRASTTAINNTSFGNSSLNSATGSGNTAMGTYAGLNSTKGNFNIFIGDSAGYQNTTGKQNTFIGDQAGITAGASAYTNITCIGYKAPVYTTTANNSINLGNTSITHICGEVGSLTTYSDRRIKEDIHENIPGLTFINKLHPVTYRINLHRENEMLGISDAKDFSAAYNSETSSQTGFIAQQVDSAAQACGYNFCGLDKPTDSSKLYSLGYSYFVISLVKAIQERQETIEQMKSENQKLSDNYKLLDQEIQNVLQKYKSLHEKNQQEIAELKKKLSE